MKINSLKYKLQIPCSSFTTKRRFNSYAIKINLGRLHVLFASIFMANLPQKVIFRRFHSSLHRQKTAFCTAIQPKGFSLQSRAQEFRKFWITNR